MQLANKLLQFIVPVSDMPKAKAVYVDVLGLTVITDVRQADDKWWVSLNAPDGGSTIVLTTFHNGKLGGMTLYFSTTDIAAAHDQMTTAGIIVNEVNDDLYGPGSGVKWFNFTDPDGNVIYLAQH